jgi:hypothetical protein
MALQNPPWWLTKTYGYKLARAPRLSPKLWSVQRLSEEPQYLRHLVVDVSDP